MARQRLREIEDLYSNAPVGLCVLDRELRWVRINDRLAEIQTAFRQPHTSANGSGICCQGCR